jgi:hypothetical protein
MRAHFAIVHQVTFSVADDITSTFVPPGINQLLENATSFNQRILIINCPTGPWQTSLLRIQVITFISLCNGGD